MWNKNFIMMTAPLKAKPYPKPQIINCMYTYIYVCGLKGVRK